MFVYMLLLELLILGMAFKARKLPANFNEVWYIVLTMFTDIVLWCLVFFTLYFSLPPREILDVFLYINFLSNFVKLVILYGYRIRIILFYPELNSPEYFRQTAAGATVTNYIKDVQSGDGTNIRRITSVVSFPSKRESEVETLLKRRSVRTLSTVTLPSSPLNSTSLINTTQQQHIPIKITRSEPTSPVKRTSGGGSDFGGDEGFMSDNSPTHSRNNSCSPLVDSGTEDLKRSIPDIRKWASSLLVGHQRTSTYVPGDDHDDCSDSDEDVFHVSTTRKCRSMDCLNERHDRLESLKNMGETSI